MTTPNIDKLSADKRRQLLEQLLREKIASETVDLEQEARIELSLQGLPIAPDVAQAPANVLATGVTGFVGAFLLRGLIERTRATLFCLVRARDAAAGLKRLRDNLAKYGIWRDEYEQRIVVVLGDLSKPGLGLSEKERQQLTETVDVIYHIAATVNLAYRYGMLKPTNVEGTREVLRLASTGKVKPVHYLSSYAPFDSVHNAGKTIYEKDIPEHWQGLSTGYNETKWVAETMVRNARRQGLPVGIYRVGWVVGHTESGYWNDSDFIPRLIQACTTLGKYTFLGVITMTPVDYLVEAMLNLSLKASSLGDTFHLSNGERYSTRQLFEWVKGYGYDVEEVPYAQWEQAMVGSTNEAALMPMRLFLENTAGGTSLTDWFSREPVIDSAYTRELLARDSVVPPRLDQELMNTYIDAFIRNGYLDPPAR